MDYIPLSYDAPTPFGSELINVLFVLAGAGLAGFGLILLRRFRKLPEHEQLNFNFVPAIFFGFVLMTTPFIMSFVFPPERAVSPVHIAAENARVPKVREAIENTYDLRISERQVEDLNYPGSKPQADFKIYGSTKTSKDHPVYLVWSEGKFVLSRVEGSTLAPLKPKD